MSKKRHLKTFLALLCAAVLCVTSVTGYAASEEKTDVTAEAETKTGTESDAEAKNETGAEEAETETEVKENPEDGTAAGTEEVKSTEDTTADVTAAKTLTDQEKEAESDTETNDAAGSQADSDSEAKTDADTAGEESESETEETVAGIPVDEEGLPKKGLLISLQMDDADDDVTDPELFVKLNPCGNKDHNTQPSNYMSSALGCAEFIFEKQSGETKWHIVSPGSSKVQERTSAAVKSNSYIATTIESYADTNDLWHSFLLQADSSDTKRIYAFVPLGIEDGSFADASDRYCFRYEAALADEQNWEMTDGSKISGGYIADGQPEDSDHEGNPVELRTVHLKRKTGGRETRMSEDIDWATVAEEDLPDAGLQIALDSFPEDGIPDSLTLHLSCPETYENGEGGFGFSSSSEYRQSEVQKWMYQITGKGGLRVLIQAYHSADDGNGTEYQPYISKQVEVAGSGISVDLTELGLEKGDRICVYPYTVDWIQYIADSDFTNAVVRPIRFFRFQYSISCEKSTLSASGMDGTKIQNVSERKISGTEAVSDDGNYLQKISLSVENSGNTDDLCGWQEDINLPDYGFVVRRGEDESWVLSGPEVTVIPQKKSGENYVWYVAQWFSENNGTYKLVYTEGAKVTKSATVQCAGKDKSKADLCVIRRIRYVIPDQEATENSFLSKIFGQGVTEYELTDSNGNIKYPQSGTDTWEVYTKGAPRQKDEVIHLQKCSVWKSADPEMWQNAPDAEESSKEETVLRGISFQTDLSDKNEKARAILADGEETTVSLKQAADNGNGLPAHSLVIMNKTEGDISGTGVEYKVQLEMPVGIYGYSAWEQTGSGSDSEKTYTFGRLQQGSQNADCHLYRQNDDGTWEKIDQNDSADWVNSGTSSFSCVTLSDSYSYGVHAHLKNNEAIVISPQTDYYDISYSVDMFSHEEYDVLPDECTIPSECTHLTRHYFQGRFSNETASSEGKTASLIIVTAPKDADSGEEDQASLLSGEKIRPLKVNLFDYDFGTEHNFILGDQNKIFRFRYDPKNVQDEDVNMWHQGAFSGILKNSLAANGLPEFLYSTPFEENGGGLFGTADVSGKTDGGTKKVYPNVDFDFIYNSEDESYSYSSALNAACFDEAENHVREYDRTLGIDGWEGKGAGFFPFNNFSEEGVWGTEKKKNKGTYLINKENGINYHFGLSTTQTFQIPEDGKVKEKNLKFHFSGDDDAWVFIDGQLVLDMGGIHEAVQGDIDFTNGTWYISADQNSPWDTFGSDYTAPIVSTGKLSDKISDFPSETGIVGGSEGAWAKGTTHTFSFFYLERGGTLSDLSMNFNLPTVKEEPTVTPTPEPEQTFVFTGGSGIRKMQTAGGALVLGAAVWIFVSRRRKKHR